jgi:hypothetical protein
VRLKLHWSIIEKLCRARQDLSDKRYAVIGFHRFDFNVDIDITGPEQQLTGRCSDATDTCQQGLIESVENEGCNDLTQATLFRLHHGLE